MSETTISILLFVHVTFIAVWIGSQVLVAVAVMPSLRRIADGPTRLETLSAFTRRFNFVAWFSLLLIVLTGGLVVGERIDDIESSYGSLFDLRWGFIFAIKMALLAAMVGLVGLHSFILGPRQLRLNREALAGAEEGTRSDLRSLQRQSILISAAGLLLSLLVLGCGVFLSNHNYSFVGV